MIVLIAVTEKQVVITDQFNTTPMGGGRNAIFARVNAPTELKAQVEIVGVYTHLETCNAARATHALSHPGRKYVQKVCHLDDGPPQEAEIPKCIRCGADVTNGRSFCPPCGNAHLKECADVGGEGDPVPLVRATHGQGAELINR